jgi:hypothetical protein
MTEKQYTEHEATDAAVLMFVRRLHRLYPEAHKAVLTSLSDDIQWALRMADNRADKLRATDAADGTIRTFRDSARIDLAELTARLGHPDHNQQAVLAWTNEDEGHLWTEAEVEELIAISAADTARIDRERG